MATDLLNAGMGDEGRLKFILSCIEKNKPLYKTDIRFLESMTNQLEWRIERLEGNTDSKQKTHRFTTGQLSPNNNWSVSHFSEQIGWLLVSISLF